MYVDPAVDAFRGHPRLLKLGNMTAGKIRQYVLNNILSDVEYLQFQISKKRSFQAAQGVMEKATNCKVLSLEYNRGNISSVDLLKLPKSSLHTLIISKLVLMQESLHQVLQCFFTLACEHPQTLKLNKVTIQCISGKIECSQSVPSHKPQTVSYWPELEVVNRQYLHLKTVELQGCFIKNIQTSAAMALAPRGPRREGRSLGEGSQELKEEADTETSSKH